MCHPAWAPARAPAPCPRELVRVRRLRDLIDRDGARRVRAAHDDRRLPLDVAALALAACSGIPPAQLTREFMRGYGVSPEEYASAGGPAALGLPPSVAGLRGVRGVRGVRGEEMPCPSVIAPAFSAGL